MPDAHGTHVFLDYTQFFPDIENLGGKILSIMEGIIDESTANRVHSHVEHFDGKTSPPGFAAVVLLDESHFTAHCYSDRGLLAIDAFTCGKTKPENIIDYLLQSLLAKIPTLQVVNRNHTARFLHDYSIESS